MRYALYFAPPEDHPLAQAASAWLGRDAFSGTVLPPPSDTGLAEEEWLSFTRDPRRYGFHATIKAPFRLAEGRSEGELVDALGEFAARQHAFTIPKLALAALGPFFALIEDEPVSELALFSAAVVTDFEPFRAPLTEADLARRHPERLSPRERELLDTWGYPYVFDEFQFHMSLTGPVPVDRAEETHDALQRHFRTFIGQPLAITHIALFREDSDGADFRALDIRPLGA
jgi:putative phosphonate metabolism protein